MEGSDQEKLESLQFYVYIENIEQFVSAQCLSLRVHTRRIAACIVDLSICLILCFVDVLQR